jgi:hypothetical protein
MRGIIDNRERSAIQRGVKGLRGYGVKGWLGDLMKRDFSHLNS